jgi:group I intron endonuclease
MYYNVAVSIKKIYSDLRTHSERAGVYMFYNHVTKQYYIGSCGNLYKRMTRYKSAANSTKHTSQKVVRSMRKNGLISFSLISFSLISFSLIILLFTASRVEALAIEQIALDTMQSALNIKKKVAVYIPVKGFLLSPSRKLNISIALKKHYKLFPHPQKGIKGEKSPQYGIGGKPVFVFDFKNRVLLFK